MDLRTTYMGLELENPVIASASPLSESVDNIKRMEDAGAAAVVMFSLFEEQIRYENEAFQHYWEVSSDNYGESLNYFPAMEDYTVGPYNYLDTLRRAA